ncbi:MAG: hypothetical protein ACREPA_12620, partial [Candidatus Dormibacteraceae bacterium]
MPVPDAALDAVPILAPGPGGRPSSSGIAGAGGHIEPLVGWRIWRVRGNRLESWVVPYTWSVGVNGGRCLSDGHSFRSGPPGCRLGAPGCSESPGSGCGCGFWALNSPAACRHLVRWWEDAELRPLGDTAVLGLMAGWGAVAVHGEEGFRAQQARVVALFAVPIGHASLRGRLADGWRTSLRRLSGRPAARRASARDLRLGGVAAAYGVPLFFPEPATRMGVLAELGVDGRAVAEIAERRRGEGRRPAPGAPV